VYFTVKVVGRKELTLHSECRYLNETETKHVSGKTRANNVQTVAEGFWLKTQSQNFGFNTSVQDPLPLGSGNTVGIPEGSGMTNQSHAAIVYDCCT
jgi:hypothetical protein